LPDPSYLAFVALGSNLGDRKAHLMAAREAISALHDTSVVQSSSLYETPAWGASAPQPDYVNAVIAVATSLTPLELWHRTAAIEQAQGRPRTREQNAARTLDIDLLLVAGIVMNTANLVLPHPRMHLRKFVLQPLLEIAPHIKIPGLGSAADLLPKIEGNDARKVSQNSLWN
jgi:2-amino-4-hydroxy-6-hydroxymethyldihydropteridine diphosphokinase